MTKTSDLLVEIGTEELPPKALKKLSAAFTESVREQLAAAQLTANSIQSYATPRRLAIVCLVVPKQQDAREIERRGPAVSAAFDADGKPTKAAEGFARSCGTSVNALEKIETDKGAWLIHRSTEAGKTITELFPEFVRKALAELPIPKRMRWGDRSVEFVRPVHWVVLMQDEHAIDVEIMDIKAGVETRGHRFHAPQVIRVKNPSSYAAQLLAEGKVLADFTERRASIKKQAEAAAKALSGIAVIEPDLLNEVTALNEWPVAVSGHFNAEFLRIPAEALISTMQDHQRYFAVRNKAEKLMPCFITMANIESREPEKVRHGNERVLHPRFADAAFFWDQDRQHKLVNKRASLDKVVFQKQLGSVGEKVERVTLLAKYIATILAADEDKVGRAAALSKCDLMTNMVFEFPELQGTMGRYYAQHDAEDSEVAQALEEQYLPRYAGDALPVSVTGQVLALAERIDTLVGIFAIGQKPSGVKDPFGLRRAALSVCRIMIECDLQLDLHALFVQSAETFPKKLKAEQAVEDVFDYTMERLRAYYLSGEQDLSIIPQQFEAVLIRRPTKPLDFHQRLLGLIAFCGLPEAESLAAANKRIRNILRKSTGTTEQGFDPQLLQETAEKNLASALQETEAKAQPFIDVGDYTQALNTFAGLKQSVDTFFDDVMVMTEDLKLRNNRIALLQRLDVLFLQVADISVLPGEAA